MTITEEEMSEVSAVNIDEWRMEIPLIEEWFAKIGSKLPTELNSEFEILKAALK
jgi:phosphoenolpyruvate carboxykinase (GTP)